jgi:SET domain-containing protein
MACKELVVKASKIEGLGLYTADPIKRGEVIMLWNVDAYLITQKEYDTRTANNDQLIIATGVRYINDHFIHTDAKPRVENYINHSFTPNVLYHCGICFAMDEIPAGTELTTDYTYLLSENEEPIIDSGTGRKVQGISGIKCLQQTTEILSSILKGI